MIVEIKDENLARRLIDNGEAEKKDLFTAYYEEEVETRILIAKDNADGTIDEEAVRAYLLNNPPYSDYDFIFNSMVESIDNFTVSNCTLNQEGE